MGPPPGDETFLKFYFFFEKSVFNREKTIFFSFFFTWTQDFKVRKGGVG